MSDGMKPATRRQLLSWLAQALCYVPANLCVTEPTFEMPPKWVKDAKAELARNGITFKTTFKRK